MLFETYLESGVDYYLIKFPNVSVITVDGYEINNLNIKVRLLTFSELNKCLQLQQTTSNLEVNEEIFKSCFLGILGFKDITLDFDKSPAGLIDTVSQIIYNESYKICTNLPTNFNSVVTTINNIETTAAAISHYLNICYTEVINYPIDKLLRLYAICHITFKLPPLVATEEVESKVG